MLKLQHMNPKRARKPDDVAIGSFNGMIGNAMSVNIVETLLAMISRACPKALEIERICLVDGRHLTKSLIAPAAGGCAPLVAVDEQCVFVRQQARVTLMSSCTCSVTT